LPSPSFLYLKEGIISLREDAFPILG